MVDFTSRKIKGFRGFDADRRRDRILSTKRTWRGRNSAFYLLEYTTNVARARFRFYLRNEFRAAGGPMLICRNVVWALYGELFE